MKTLLSAPLKLLLLLIALPVLSSCGSVEDRKAALQDYQSGSMSYEVRRKSQMDARQEPMDGRIKHFPN